MQQSLNTNFSVFIFIFFVLGSCSEAPNVLDQFYYENLSNPSNQYNDLINDKAAVLNYLYSKSIFEEDRSRAIEILNEVRNFVPRENRWSHFYQDVIADLQRLSSNYDVHGLEQIDYHLDSLGLDSHNLILCINLLETKSQLLNAYSKPKYAIATALYAMYLRSQLPSGFENKPSFIPFVIPALAYDREQNNDLAKFYYKKAKNSIVSDSDGARFVNYFFETSGQKISPNQYNELIKRYIDSTKVNNQTNITISQDLLTKINEEQSIKLAQEVISKSSNYCSQEVFFEITYMIDAMLALSMFKETEKWINVLKECDLKPIQEYYVKFRELKFLSKKYNSERNIKTAMLILQKSRYLKNLYSDFGDDLLNEHYADVIYRCNEDAISVLHSLSLKNELDNNRNQAIEELDNFKILYNRISDASSLFTGKIVTTEITNKFIETRISLDRMELNIDNYQDTIHDDLAKYEKLYTLHKELYDMRTSLKVDTNYKTIPIAQNRNYDLHEKMQIIDILMTDNDYFITSITDKTIDIIKLNKLEAENELNKLHPATIKIGMNTKDQPISSIIFELFDTSKTEVYVVPDGSFVNVPFELLLPQLFEKKDLSFTYKASIGECFDQMPITLNSSASIFSFSDQVSISSTSIKSIPELQVGYEEANKVSELYSSASLYAGSNFKKETINKAISSHILHFSTHSYSSLTNRLENYISLNNIDGKSRKFYGFELEQYDLNKKLIVLSSCNSGTGIQKPGTGVFSLSRDFLQAGAETVIKSLWSVNEASTKELMVEMHRNFTNGQSIADALANAKRTIKKIPAYEHPYYWAGFVLEGNPHVYLEQPDN